MNCLVKNLTSKTQWEKTLVKEKRVRNTFISPPHEEKYLLDGEDQFLIQVSQKLYLGVLCNNICKTITRTNLLNADISILLKITSEKEYGRNMFCSVSFNVSFFQLSNTCCIIFINDCCIHSREVLKVLHDLTMLLLWYALQISMKWLYLHF